MRWYKKWRSLQSPDSLKKFAEFLPENNPTRNTVEVLKTLWEQVHAQSDVPKKLRFRGIPKPVVKVFDPAVAEREVHERWRKSQLPTTNLDRITLNVRGKHK